MSAIRILLLAWATLFFLVGAARADVAVSPEMVCSVQRAIGRQPTWPESECQRVAAALNETPRPRTVLAMAILESDLRTHVAVEARPGVFDVGLLGVRCVTSAGDATRAETWTLSAGAPIAKRETAEPASRCQNGPARGHTLVTLSDPVTNIAVAAEIMAEKRSHFGKAWLLKYNGATRENGYTRKVRVIEAALGGTRMATKNKRVRRLVDLILAVTAPRIAMER